VANTVFSRDPTGELLVPSLPPAADSSTKYVASIETDAGVIEIDLWPDLAPQTVGNFVGLAEDGFYDGTIFHRVIRGFMVQGGCPQGDGRGSPGYQFGDEFNARRLVRGVVAMANAGPNTNGSQFFIVTAPATPHLDGAHTGFGEVISGMEVVDAIEGTATGRGDRPITDQRVVTINVTASDGA
jgi:cyclophilin family peptidyl-prolyl cis-trans isomerase